MKAGQFNIVNFLTNRIRDVLVAGVILSGLILVLLGNNSLLQYLFGLMVGIANFVLLTIGINLILFLKPIAARIVHFIFFALRYLAITIVIVLFILHRNANVFVVIGGVLTMNFSIFASETIKHLFLRKEG